MPGVKGRSGRKPKTVEQHKADGTYRADVHGDRIELHLAPVPAGELPPPAHLAAAGRELWVQLVDLFPASITRANIPGLEVYCETWDLYQQLRPRMAADPTDRDVRTAWRAVSDVLDRCGRQWGWTPLAMASIRVPPPPPPEDDFSKWLTQAEKTN